MDHIELSDDFRKTVRELRAVARSNPKLLRSLPQLCQSAADCFRIKNDSLFAVGTDDLVITLEPSERLVEFLSTARTRNGRIEKVEAKVEKSGASASVGMTIRPA